MENGFVNNDGIALLSAAQIAEILENADPSTQAWTAAGTTFTTPFCFSSNVFSIVSTGRVGNISRTIKTVVERNYAEDTLSREIQSYPDAPQLFYWREL